jgi:hypothetical protein
VLVDHERHFSNASADDEVAEDATISLPPGRVSLADVVRTLRLAFPWKSDAALSQLHRALLADLRGQPQIDYTTLLSHHPHVASSHPPKPNAQPQAKCQFAECLKMQRLDDLLTFRRHVQCHIRRHVLPNSSDNDATGDIGAALMISLRDLRACLRAADSAMPELDVTRALAAVSGLSARELLTHDDMMLDTRQVLQRLPTLLLRPTGRFSADPTP